MLWFPISWPSSYIFFTASGFFSIHSPTMKKVIFNAEYPNGLVQEIEDIEISKEDKIAQLKAQLDNTDYQAIKYAEGWISEEDYAPVKEQRQAWREEINILEGEH